MKFTVGERSRIEGDAFRIQRLLVSEKEGGAYTTRFQGTGYEEIVSLAQEIIDITEKFVKRSKGIMEE